ncbi:MAG: RNA polymerase subunit sigma-24 [Anaerolineae bacterium SM23_84]|nr:MAG: RNA polymerase subunit sigma-24 [Anaerolineae bacterium SM23_84]
MDEQALVAAARRGDTQAFNKLILTYQTLAYNVAYRTLHDPEAAADATQQAFISAFRALPKFRGGSFKAWLLRIVTNACYDQLRRAKRRPASSLDDMLVDPDHSALLTDETESPEERAERQDLGYAIQRGLDELPPDQRLTVVLSDIQGFSYQEIAEVTSVSLGTVKSRLSRGRARLRDYLQRQEELLPRRYRPIHR